MKITSDHGIWADNGTSELQLFRGLFGPDVAAVDICWTCDSDGLELAHEFFVSFQDGRQQAFSEGDVAWMQAQAALLRAGKRRHIN